MKPDPKYIPENPPGFVFVTNNGFLNKEESEHHAELGEMLGIPAKDFLTLRGIAPPPSISSTFVEEKWSQRVLDWQQYLQNTMDRC